MGHKIVEAIIEDGQIKYVDKKLPPGRIKVHLIYDAAEEISQEIDRLRIVGQTSGIYKNIDGEAESRKLRASWERNISD
jgi:predicted DNA-binding antitoxin AbrB/MazE fold protein